MMPATKESYASFQEALVAAGVSSLAIDFRGHGESVLGPNRQKLEYKQFSDAEHQAKYRDIEAAIAYLADTYQATSDRVVLVGASIGANLALQYLAAHAEVPGAILLSPGLNYHEIPSMSFTQSLTRDRNILLIAAEDDPESAAAVDKLAERSLAKTDVILLKAGGHGTDVLGHAETQKQVVDWICSNIGT